MDNPDAQLASSLPTQKATVVKDVKLSPHVNYRQQCSTTELVAADAVLSFGSSGIVAPGRPELSGKTSQYRLAGPGRQQYDETWTSRNAVDVDIGRLMTRMRHRPRRQASCGSTYPQWHQSMRRYSWPEGVLSPLFKRIVVWSKRWSQRVVVYHKNSFSF